MSKQVSKGIFSLEATRDNGRMKIGAFEKFTEDEKTIRHYEFHNISDEEINKICASVIDIFNRANKRGEINKTALTELQIAGQLLYDSLLTNQVKKKLASTTAEHMIVNVDERLVHIPWELLFDGKSFLCHKFSIGRVVSTSQRISDPSVRKTKKPFKMLIVADPRGDLDSSYNEGERLTDELDNSHEIVEVNLRSSPVDIKFLKGVLRNYDAVHYAGHADYDINNPSNSGFLLQDGKLNASDIINMIGEMPLPSLIFSNACKSGHTEIGKIREDYETEIYGLANAFLLAGVQHYIGTFWDIQDEPSLYFALDFYRELMLGAMIGEAIRKARLKLIDRYGEDAIIWASYMLYGDPTVRYTDSAVTEESSERTVLTERRVARKEELVTGKGMRSADEVIVFPQKKHKWILFGSVIIFILAIIIFFSIGKTRKDNTFLNTTVVFKQDPAEAKKNRIDKLVAFLSRPYRENQKTGKSLVADSNISRLPTLVFLNIRAQGVTEIDKEYIFDTITESLHNSKRVDVIEREVLDALLEELHLSFSQLTDLPTALKVGRLLSAKLITVGNILKEGNAWQINLRFIETETSSIKAALTETLRTNEKEAVAERLSKGIIQKIRREYPLHGKVLTAEENRVVLDIGSKDGIMSGLLMNVLFETEGIVTTVGKIKIISVHKDTSIANVIMHRDEIREGLKVEEII
jgi:CHAT domain-containing protein